MQAGNSNSVRLRLALLQVSGLHYSRNEFQILQQPILLHILMVYVLNPLLSGIINYFEIKFGEMVRRGRHFLYIIE